MTTPELQTPDAAGAKVAGGALLIDVRSAAGRASAGEIPGATLADRNDLDALFGPSDNPAITLDTPVVIVCGSINGSGPVAEALAARGYTDVSHVDGGFPAWKEAGLPATEAAGQPANGTADQPASDQPATDQPASDQNAADLPAVAPSAAP